MFSSLRWRIIHDDDGEAMKGKIVRVRRIGVLVCLVRGLRCLQRKQKESTLNQTQGIEPHRTEASENLYGGQGHSTDGDYRILLFTIDEFCLA